MKSTAIKWLGVLLLAGTLSGCIMYVAPDHTLSRASSADEKPAPTDGKSF